MPKFTYRAKKSSGEVSDGTLEAENQAVAVKKLRQDGLFPLTIEEVVTLTGRSVRGYKVSNHEVAVFTRQLANLVHAGFNIANAMATLEAQAAGNSYLKKVIGELHSRMLQGQGLSDALRNFPDIFSGLYINLVTIGETSGTLDQTLNRLADFKEKEDELRMHISSALVYPGFIFLFGMATVFVLVTFFIPRFVTLFSDFGQALPLPTQIIIGLSSFMSKFWWLVIVGLFGVFFLFKSAFKQEKNRMLYDSFVTNIPLLKDMVQKVEITRFAYSFGLLLKNGVPILEALDVVGQSVGNSLYRKKFSVFREEIRKGKSLSGCLAADKLFPVTFSRMVAVGEESGELSEMLFRIAQTYEAEVSRAVKVMVSLLEPMLVVFIGGIIMLIVFSMLLPIFQLNFMVS